MQFVIMLYMSNTLDGIYLAVSAGSLTRLRYITSEPLCHIVSKADLSFLKNVRVMKPKIYCTAFPDIASKTA